MLLFTSPKYSLLEKEKNPPTHVEIKWLHKIENLTRIKGETREKNPSFQVNMFVPSIRLLQEVLNLWKKKICQSYLQQWRLNLGIQFIMKVFELTEIISRENYWSNSISRNNSNRDGFLFIGNHHKVNLRSNGEASLLSIISNEECNCIMNSADN